jgi:methionyl-tRNA formyltransferase
MKIQILIDNPNSWAVSNAKNLVSEISKNHSCKLIHSHEEVENGDILFLLSCEKKFTQFEKNKHNIVVHQSDLPSGKGWSPMAWQILEGKNTIPITLFEANEKIDSGDYYIKDSATLDSSELAEEARDKVVIVMNKMILRFISDISNMKPIKQTGSESFYRKRTAEDSGLDINKTISEQFNLLRVVDNERYPAFFIKDGVKYIIKIEKEKN